MVLVPKHRPKACGTLALRSDFYGSLSGYTIFQVASSPAPLYFPDSPIRQDNHVANSPNNMFQLLGYFVFSFYDAI
jgi:hypothetical protein